MWQGPTLLEASLIEDLKIRDHFEQRREHFVRRLHFQAVGAEPGFVAAQFVLAGVR